MTTDQVSQSDDHTLRLYSGDNDQMPLSRELSRAGADVESKIDVTDAKKKKKGSKLNKRANTLELDGSIKDSDVGRSGADDVSFRGNKQKRTLR